MSKNDITGDSLTSKVGNKEAFDANYDRIWGKHPAMNPESPPMSKLDWIAVIVCVSMLLAIIPAIWLGRA